MKTTTTLLLIPRVALLTACDSEDSDDRSAERDAR
ncbi:hypothetical protein BH23GEM3_BH23GEM3_04030 [soil metagenome]